MKVLTIINTLLICICLAGIARFHHAMQSSPPNSIGEAPKPPSPPIQGNECRPLLEGDFFDSVFWLGEDDVMIRSDVDCDGLEERVFLGRDHPNGIRFRVYNGEESFALRIPADGLTGFGDLREGGYCQLAIKDVTNDGRPELLLAVSGGNGLAENHLTIWGYDNHVWENAKKGERVNPYMLIAQFNEIQEYRILHGGKIEIPVGGQGLFEVWNWDGKKFIKEDR